MIDEQTKEVQQAISLMTAKLGILRNFLIIADEGLRQQQSAANDETISVLRDINAQLNQLIRMIEK